jgi:hypothetical protein
VKSAVLYACVGTPDRNRELRLHDLRCYAGQQFSFAREYIDVAFNVAWPQRFNRPPTTDAIAQIQGVLGAGVSR